MSERKSSFPCTSMVRTTRPKAQRSYLRSTEQPRPLKAAWALWSAWLPAQEGCSHTQFSPHSCSSRWYQEKKRRVCQLQQSGLTRCRIIQTPADKRTGESLLGTGGAPQASESSRQHSTAAVLYSRATLAAVLCFLLTIPLLVMASCHLHTIEHPLVLFFTFSHQDLGNILFS